MSEELRKALLEVLDSLPHVRKATAEDVATVLSEILDGYKKKKENQK